MGTPRRAAARVPHPGRSEPVPMERGSRATAGGARARRLNAATGSAPRPARRPRRSEQLTLSSMTAAPGLALELLATRPLYELSRADALIVASSTYIDAENPDGSLTPLAALSGA